MHLHTDNNVIQLLLTILFCCARWCWRENWWKWAKWADSITVSIIKAVLEMRRSPRATRVCPKFVSLSLASQEIGHMSNPTITWREAEETKKWAPNKRTHNKNYCVICISKYLLFSSSVNCCRTNDSFPLHSNRKKTNVEGFRRAEIRNSENQRLYTASLRLSFWHYFELVSRF